LRLKRTKKGRGKKRIVIPRKAGGPSRGQASPVVSVAELQKTEGRQNCDDPPYYILCTLQITEKKEKLSEERGK